MTSPSELRIRIHEKADALAGQNTQPSLARIMSEIGGTAPPELVLPHLQEWRIVKALLSHPDDHAASWQALTESLHIVTDDVRSIESMLQRKALDEARIVTDEESVKWRGEHDRRIADLAAERDRIQKELAELAQKQGSGAAASAAEASEHERNAVRLSRELQAARNQIAELRRSLDGERDEKRRLLEARNHQETERSEADNQAKLQADHEIASLRGTLAQRESTLAAVHENADVMRRASAEKDEMITQAEQKIEGLTQQLDSPKNTKSPIDAELSDMPFDLETDLPGELPRRLALASVRIAALRAERNALRAHLEDTRVSLERTYTLLERVIPRDEDVDEDSGSRGAESPRDRGQENDSVAITPRDKEVIHRLPAPSA